MLKKKSANRFTYFGTFCLILFSFLLWQRYTPRRLSFNISQLPNKTVNKNENKRPKVLIIKDLGLELEIFPAKIENNNWEATTRGVSYLTSSAIPGDNGNSVIYGHNWPNLLGRVTKLRPGGKIEIIFDDGSRRIFEIEFTQIVTPDQIYVLDQTEDKRLTLYTCTGFLDTKRFVVTAVYKDYPIKEEKLEGL